MKKKKQYCPHCSRSFTFFVTLLPFALPLFITLAFFPAFASFLSFATFKITTFPSLLFFPRLFVVIIIVFLLLLFLLVVVLVFLRWLLFVFCFFFRDLFFFIIFVIICRSGLGRLGCAFFLRCGCCNWFLCIILLCFLFLLWGRRFLVFFNLWLFGFYLSLCFFSSFGRSCFRGDTFHLVVHVMFKVTCQMNRSFPCHMKSHLLGPM